MPPILSYPKLAGMEYPQLESAELIHFVPGPDKIPLLPESERALVRVLMTSASRGCRKDVIEALPNLGFVVSQGAGTELIDIDYLSQKSVKLRCVGEALTDDVADLAMAFATMLVRGVVRADHFARSGEWLKERFELRDSLVGMTMGIAGLSGRIGQAIAARAKVSRMKIAGLDRPSNQGFGASLHKGWRELAEASDILVLAVPGTSELRHTIGAVELSALGSRGYLINVGRGSLVDTLALIEALEKGTIAGAALDVIEDEPSIPARLAALPNVILTPHIGGQTWGQRARAAKIAEDEVLTFLNKGQNG